MDNFRPSSNFITLAINRRGLSNLAFNFTKDMRSFIVRIRIKHKLVKILKRRGSFLNVEKGVWFDFLKPHLIIVSQNTPNDNGNLGHLLFEKCTMSFIVFIN